MASLLMLTREIRDIIFDFVLQTPSHRLINLPPRSEEREILDGPLRWTEGHMIRPENVTDQRRPESLSLLQTNHQVHCEIKQRLHLLGRALNYRLDLTIVNEHELWPTWTKVPAPVKCIPEVSVALHSHGARTSRAMVSGFADIGEGAPLAWALRSLLVRFLLFGPIARDSGTSSSRKNCKNKCAIQRLHIDIGKSTLEEGQRLACPGLPICQAEWPQQYQSDELFVVPPETLAIFVVKALDDMLYQATYNTDVFERDGRICFKCGREDEEGLGSQGYIGRHG